MNRKNKIIMGVILVAILLMGIGYAQLRDTDLTIGGSASASASQDNFNVVFTGVTPEVETDGNVVIDVEDDSTEATITITGLDTKNQVANAILEIQNKSEDIAASSINVTAGENVTTEDKNFTITSTMCDITGAPVTDSGLAANGGKTYVKVQVKLNVTPTSDDDITADIDVTVTATPEK